MSSPSNAGKTPYLDLHKPAYTEPVDVAVLNDNFDKIDNALLGAVPKVFTFEHHEEIPKSSWTINHNLDGYPSVTVVDSAGSVVKGMTMYPDRNTVIVEFTSAFSGKAYLS